MRLIEQFAAMIAKQDGGRLADAKADREEKVPQTAGISLTDFEDETVYRPKLERVAAGLRSLSSDPYVQRAPVTPSSG